jgi:hypothetical protein
MKIVKFLILILTLTIFSCSDYLDVNKNPNQLEFDKVAPPKILPAAQLGTYRVQTTTMNQLGNVFMNSWASNVASFTGGFAREMQLNVDNSFYPLIWENLYLNVNNYQQIINFPNSDHKYDNHVAIAKIMKAFYMQYIVDLYGDAPYDEAFKGGANTTPKYNDDQKIYRSLLKSLDEARAIIAAANPGAEDVAPYDIILHGDMSTWNNFANTIELRMLLRMSNTTGVVKAYQTARLAALAGATFITSDIHINPGFSTSNDDQLNPFYGAYLTDAAGVALTNYTFVCTSGHAYKALSAYSVYPTGATTEIIAGSGVSYPNVADPRRGRLFRNGAGQPYLRGVTQGSDVVDMFPPTGVTGLPGRNGYGLFNPNNQVSAPLTAFTDYAANDGYIMTAAESYFLQAEAGLKGYPGFSDGQAAFESGITASFTYLTATLGTYITTINTKPNFGWTGTDTEKLHAIMYQKWVGLMGINGIESFIDYNRTGFPLTPLATVATQTRKPRRLIYPVSEYIANAANVPSISKTQIFATTDPSHPFWMLGDPALGN